MLPRFLACLTVLSLLGGLSGACAPAADGAAGASASSGGEEPAPPPPPADGEPEAPAAVPPTTANTPQAAKVVPVADPATASSDIYEVVLDSKRMRILRGTWKPGQKDEPHGHPPLIAYALTDVEALSHGDTDEPIKVQIKAGQAFFQNALASHTFENVGKKTARLLIVELKQGVPPGERPEGMAPDALSASPDVYHKVFEDRHVRVLYADWPGKHMDELHSHPSLAAYMLTDVDAKLHEQFGQTIDVELKKGQALYEEPVKGHTLENMKDEPARMVLFEPKALAYGVAAGGAAGEGGEAAELKVEEGNGEVTSFVDKRTGVKMDIGSGFTLEIPAGVRFVTVVTFKKTHDRPSSKSIHPDFTRHAATLVFDGIEKKFPKPVVVSIGISRMPTRDGQKFVLAMEESGECTKANRRYELPDGGCSVWTIVPTEFDEKRGKVIAKLPRTGGYRLQFGWMPE